MYQSLITRLSQRSTRADLSTSFSERRTYENVKARPKIVPASCSYDFDVSDCKVVALPSMMMSALSLKAIFISSSETSNSRYPVSGPVTAAQWQQQQRQEAVDHSTDLSKMLAASAPVLEMRQCVQLGLQQYVLRWVNNKKIKPGADIVFSNAMKSRR
ncbi:hypothetical protein O9929_11300 [Vibrio lentus]|nr:hypothetical protein [Vibrio lentus]